jgi:hypothetical protein
MSTVYERAKADVHEMADGILRQHHPKLRLTEGEFVRLCILMATAECDGEGLKEPAIKLHGYPCAAVISIIPYKQRVDKRADAEIIIDAEWWDNATEPQQRALLDHEITHLEIQRDENGFVRTDDVGRPKLKMRLHDFDFGGFREIAIRHGSNAPEVEAARKFEREYGVDVLGTEQLFSS